MTRITEINQDGRWTVKDSDGNTLPWEMVPRNLYGAMCKLKDYESTELSPHDVEELKEMSRWISTIDEVPMNCDPVLAYVKAGRCGKCHLRRSLLLCFF